MPTPPTYRVVINGRMVTVANRLDKEARKKYIEVNIYPGPEMTGEPEHEVKYDYVFADFHAEVARMANAEFPPNGLT